MSDYTEAANYMLLAAESNDSWMKDRALRRGADELTRLQSEVERLRGRCERLQAAVPWTIYGDNLTATILRKQAEAVDSVIMRIREARHEVDRTSLEESDTACTLRIAESIAISEAQRLRQQADEAKKAGGES